jgi:hypothetical protein
MSDPDLHQPHHHLGLIDDPHAHLSAALVLSLALWMPFGLAVMHGDLDVLAAGVRYLVAFVGCRVAVGGIAHLLRSYRHLATGELAAEVQDELRA